MSLGGDPRGGALLVDDARPDLDGRERIRGFVRDFYRDVAQDDLLGPIFAAAHVDWPAHLATLTDFWVWQLLGERGYTGNPLRAHAAVDDLVGFRAEHFARWLAIFDETVDERFAGRHAELAKQRARRMARALARLLRGESAPGTVALEPVLQPGVQPGRRARAIDPCDEAAPEGGE
jgi:hemoglobin